MTAYINTVTNVFPYSTQRFRADNSNTSFPNPIPEAVLKERGIYPVEVVPQYTKYGFNVSRDEFPIKKDGVWTLGFTEVQMTQVEIDTANTAGFGREKKAFMASIQTYLDTTADDNGYDGIISACSYAGAQNPFQLEGIAFVKWRGAVWGEAITILDAVLSGAIPRPTTEELLNMLPAYGH